MKHTHKTISLLLLLQFVLAGVYAQKAYKSWGKLVCTKDTVWLASQDAKRVADNVVLYQREIGGWPKNIPMQKELSKADIEKLIALKKETKGVTIDNGATCNELIFLSKVYKYHPDPAYKSAFLSGINYLLVSQYENGGWPQYYPLHKGYYTHITFNDDAMVNVLEILREIANKTDHFTIAPSSDVVVRARIAFNKGIACILNTQYRQNGVLTVWCAQHDEFTLLPAKARAYELPSLSGSESAKIVELLMQLPNPSPRIITAVEAAKKWFEQTKIEGYAEKRIVNEKGKVIDKILEADSTAQPIWGRFVDLETNKAFFCDRDGIKKESYAEIGNERRSGYAWYTGRPNKIFKKYNKWRKMADEQIAKEKNLKNTITVAQDFSGDFTHIQDAINATKAFPYERITIYIKEGVYFEKVHIYEWNTNLTLQGEDSARVRIIYNDYFDKIDLGRNSTFHTPTMLVEGEAFIAKNLTIENSSGEVGQAIALTLNADRVQISHCRFLGNQDVLYLTGSGHRQFFDQCYVEGTTDFIFGSATVYFQNCEIRSKTDSYITAASTPKGQQHGFVFKSCKLTSTSTAKQVYLGRPWRIYAKTVFLDCNLGPHIRPEGWHNWSKPDAEKLGFYAEYNSTGPGSQPKQRVSWSHQLTKKQAEAFSLENVIAKSSW